MGSGMIATRLGTDPLRFRDLYINARGEHFVIIWGVLQCIPLWAAVKKWPRATTRTEWAIFG